MNPDPLPSLPSLFVPHGSPMFALEPGMAGEVMSRYARTLPNVRAIVAISAHWDTESVVVGFNPRPHTIHDFYGFPAPLYQLRYPATGCPSLAQKVFDAVAGAGLTVSRDPLRGLDHGAWLPLRQMFPDGDVPVVPVSIQSRGGPEQAWRLGRSLAPLTAQGFVVLASGNLTHNLGDFRLGVASTGHTPAYVRAFSDWIKERLGDADVEALLDYRRRAPGAIQAHPSDEHLLPLFVALGAAGARPAAERVYAGVDFGVLAMDIYAFHRQTSQETRP